MIVSSENSNSLLKISAIRRILPQFLATFVVNTYIFDIAFTLSIDGVIISALTGISESNKDEILKLTPEQASWLGSIGSLVLPLGTLTSGFITDSFGYKRPMIFSNIFFAIGWYFLRNATEIWHIFVPYILLKLTAGWITIMSASYVSGICDSSLRSFLVGFGHIFSSIGVFSAITLNTLVPWRKIAFIGLTLPFISAMSTYFIPESPQWLLSKSREADAEHSLMWLRGWVPSQTVAQEFEKLQQHSQRSKSCYSCTKKNLQCTHPPPTLRQKLTEIKRKSFLKPFGILVVMCTITTFSGMVSMMPFLMPIFKAYESPVAPEKAMVILTFIDNIAHFAFICVMKFTGKRLLFLTTGSMISICALVLAIYGFVFLPSGSVSFNQQNHSFHLDSILTYIPMVCLIAWSAITACGFTAMPSFMLLEFFPLKIRGIAIGIGVTTGSLIAFFAKRSYLGLETTLSLPGVALFFSILTGFSMVLSYFIFPETEGLSLEDIELHFADNSKKITDWKIKKSPENHTDNRVNVYTIDGKITNDIENKK